MLAGWVALAAFVLLFAAGGVWLHDFVTRPAPKPQHFRPAFIIEPLDVTPGSAVPYAPAAVPASVPGPHDPREQWLSRVADEVDVPIPALRAYVNAATATAATNPSCHLTWTTLAGIGLVESRHGQYHGDTLTSAGEEQTPIIGPALDGSPGFQKVPSTDGGKLDGDPVWEHAIGPMQFLPSKWLTLGVRASGDGRPPDPQNINDAALTSARYLCQSGDLSVPANWWKAVYTYNNSVSYGQQVFSGADAYARTAR